MLKITNKQLEKYKILCAKYNIEEQVGQEKVDFEIVEEKDGVNLGLSLKSGNVYILISPDGSSYT
jgi:hypothetical protein